MVVVIAAGAFTLGRKSSTEKPPAGHAPANVAEAPSNLKEPDVLSGRYFAGDDRWNISPEGGIVWLQRWDNDFMPYMAGRVEPLGDRRWKARVVATPESEKIWKDAKGQGVDLVLILHRDNETLEIELTGFGVKGTRIVRRDYSEDRSK